MNKTSITLATLLLLLAGCSEKPQESGNTTEAATEKAAAAPANKPVDNLYGTSTQPQTAAAEENHPQTNNVHVAKVIETMDAAGYTYVKVDEDGQIYWIAGPESKVTVGSNVSYLEQMMMQDFTSKTLNRTFDMLMFTSTIIPEGKADSAAAAPAVAAQAAAPHYSDTQAAQQAPSDTINVAKAEGGYTVEELYAKKAALKGQKVTLKAKVIKVSKNIMGKDWVHLQDGTGVAGSSDDIVATGLNTTVQAGDTVTATATLNTDVDLGYGYFFTVILEESSFTN